MEHLILPVFGDCSLFNSHWLWIAITKNKDEECSICLDSLPQEVSKYACASCCGKGMHIKCRDNMYWPVAWVTNRKTSVWCSEQSILHRRRRQSNSFVHGLKREKRGRKRRWVISTTKVLVLINPCQSYQQAKELYELAKSKVHVWSLCR